MRSIVVFLRLGAAALLFAAGGCGGGGTSASSFAANATPATLGATRSIVEAGAIGNLKNLTGLYAGTVQDSVDGLGAVSLNVVDYDGTAQGTGQTVTDSGTSAVSLAGTVTGKTISGSITVQETGCVYGVVLTVKGKTLSGPYTPTGSCSNSGNTTLTLVPPSVNASGKYTGTIFDETDGTQGTLKLSLAQTGSGLSGQFTLKTVGGSSTGSISGTISEAVATVGISVTGDTCSPYNATLIAYAKSFYGYYSSTVCTLVGYLTLKK